MIGMYAMKCLYASSCVYKQKWLATGVITG